MTIPSFPEHESIAKKLWDLSDDLDPLKPRRSYIYSGGLKGIPVYLRFKPHVDVSVKDVQAELDWQYYLASNCNSIVYPIRSKNNNFVELISVKGKESFVASLYLFALGEDVHKQDRPFEKKCYDWGRAIGTMHRLTKDYTVEGAIRRPHWRKAINMGLLCQTSLRNEAKNIYKDETLASGEKTIDVLIEISEWINSLPEEKESFGLVHGDVQENNFVVNDEGLHIFDFSDCCYHWFAYDIAYPLYYISEMDHPHALDHSKGLMREEFYKGYFNEVRLEEKWIQRIPAFLKYRAAVIYHTMRRNYVLGHLSEVEYRGYQKNMSWVAKELSRPCQYI
ncbi:hypothetical protein DID77_04045 [Candidatus Marinamargulisbacteria bacterium SCGC AG-439-L15]|nr:hypothetical protein DID77_04045 [Candidatus Marinamargulisbacteria bacterium SCGC AG-439-L15]